MNRINFLGKVNARSHSWVTMLSVTAGIVPPEKLPDAIESLPLKQVIVDQLLLVDDYTAEIPVIPSWDSADYDAAQEALAQSKIDFIGSQIDKLYPDYSIAFGNIKQNIAKDGSIITLSLLNKVLNRGEVSGLFDACLIKFQFRVDGMQQVPDVLGVTPLEISSALENITYVSRGCAYSALTSQSAKYILQSSRVVKADDQAAFTKWRRSHSSPLVMILNVSVSNIPFSYAPEEILAFERNPTDRANRTLLQIVLIEFQRELIKTWRECVSAGSNFNTAFDQRLK
jgi:hypothetical protein